MHCWSMRSEQTSDKRTMYAVFFGDGGRMRKKKGPSQREHDKKQNPCTARTRRSRFKGDLIPPSAFYFCCIFLSVLFEPSSLPTDVQLGQDTGQGHQREETTRQALTGI